jgi:hypothetical protein
VKDSQQTAASIHVIVFSSNSRRNDLENTMPGRKPPKISLPKSWTSHVRSAVLRVVSLAQFATAYTRSWAANIVNARIRLKTELDRAKQEIVLLREQNRIKDARMARTDPHHRPHYPPTERMAVLELRAARGWSLEQTAEAFVVTAATIACWMKRVDEEGADAMVQLREPVNRSCYCPASHQLLRRGGTFFGISN